MAGSVSCRVEQLSGAEPAEIYDLLMDVESWPEWMPTASAASWERRGEPDTEKGGVRRMRFGLIVIRDLIDEGPNGSRIIWSVTCASRFPGLEKSLRSSYTRLAAALAHQAEGAAGGRRDT
jgi:hypothetical protein